MKKSIFWKKVDFLEPLDQKNGFPTQFAIKITVFWGEKNFKIVLKIIVQFLPFWWLFKNVLFCQPYEIVHILKKQNFLELLDQKNGFLTPFTIKITVYWPKIFFQNFWKNWSKLWLFSSIFHHHPTRNWKQGGGGYE